MGPTSTPKRAFPRRLGRGFFALVCVLLGAELGLRYLLFSPDPVARALGGKARRADHFAAPDEDAYWRLRVAFAGREIGPHEFADRQLGWTSRRVVPGTLEHIHASHLKGRRPLLLYGDSFAHCKTPSEHCWSALLEDTLWSRKLGLLNYGCEGYGLDQTAMMLLDTLDQWMNQDPVVVVSLLLDDDLERSGLGFRGWSKPKFELQEDGRLVRTQLAEEDLSASLAARPIGVLSFVGRLAQGSIWVPKELRRRLRSVDARQDHLERVNRAILELLHGELEARGVEYFFLLFHGKSLLGKGDDWAERLVTQTLDDLGAPYVSTRSSFELERLHSGTRIGDYFLEERGAGHYNPGGNRVAFRAILRGLEGMFDAPQLLVPFADTRRCNLPQEQRRELWELGPGPDVVRPRDEWRLRLPASTERATYLRYPTRGPVGRLTFDVRPLPGATTSSLLVIKQRLPGREDEVIRRRMIRPDARRHRITLELNDPHSLVFSVHVKGDQAGESGGVLLSAPWAHPHAGNSN